MWKCTVCSVTPEGSTLMLLRLSPDDSGTYTCLAVSPAGQESKIYTVFVLGQYEPLISTSLCQCWGFMTDSVWLHSPTIHLRRDHGPQRGSGNAGECCNFGMPGFREPPSSDQLAEERPSSASLSSSTPPLWRLRAEVSFRITNLTSAEYNMFIIHMTLSVPLL